MVQFDALRRKAARIGLAVLGLLLAFQMGYLASENKATRDGSSTHVAAPATTEVAVAPEVAAAVSLASKKCLDIQVDDKVENRILPTPDEIDKCLMYQPPTQLVQVIMNFAVGAPNQGRCGGTVCSKNEDYVELLRMYGNDWPPYGYTMVGKARLENFRAAIHEVDRNNIDGAIIEAGVWRGGAMIMAAAVSKEAQSNRDLYLYDAFEIIPGYDGSRDFLANSQEDVESNFDLFALHDPKKIHFVKGLFKDTVPLWKKGTQIAVLRVDGNFYDSYSDVLYAMYSDVAVGGIVIFDDVMSHPDVMRCWKDFKKDQGLGEDLIRIDSHSAWFRKREEVKIDALKKHPPYDVNKR